jgi:hypothetical protein
LDRSSARQITPGLIKIKFYVDYLWHGLMASPVSPIRETGLFVCKPTPISSYLPADLFQAAFRVVSFRVPSAEPVRAEQVRAPVWPQAALPV